MGSRTTACLLLAIFFFLLAAPDGPANNLRVENIALSSLDTGTKRVSVQFDIGWDNSWRTDVNRDAAWVFVKFRPAASSAWEHATIWTNNTDHREAAGSVINASPDGMGAFIYRSANGTGTVNYVRTRLVWNYGADGYDFQNGDQVNVSVQAVEMVYIPEGAFYLGSGGTEDGHCYEYTDGIQSTNPFLVVSENALLTDMANGALWGTGGTTGNNAVSPAAPDTIPAAFPKGYAAFYCMKYELSQGQYVSFLNLLTDVQDNNRYSASSVGYRYTISGTYTNYSATAPDRACNYLSWADGTAYTDWAGLRLLTELEFEKTCRGTEAPVPGEWPWGDTSFSQPTLIINDGTPDSTVNQGNLHDYRDLGGVGGGPIRCGIFAASTTNPTRTQAGAGYYGAMELGGNLWEMFVTVGNAAGRVYTGLHGDGVLTVSGDANTADWPNNGTGVGSGVRGGVWYDGRDWCRTSSRALSVYPFSSRSYKCGWRSGRTAP